MYDAFLVSNSEFGHSPFLAPAQETPMSAVVSNRIAKSTLNSVVFLDSITCSFQTECRYLAGADLFGTIVGKP